MKHIERGGDFMRSHADPRNSNVHTKIRKTGVRGKALEGRVCVHHVF